MNEKTKDLIFTSVMITLFAVVSFVLFSFEKSGGLVEFAIEQGIEPSPYGVYSLAIIVFAIVAVVVIFLREGFKQKMDGMI